MKNFFQKAFSPYYHLKPFFLKNFKKVFIGFALLISVDALQLITPFLIKKTVDALTEGQATNKFLLTYAALIIILSLIITIIRFFWRIFIFGHARKLEQNLRGNLFRHIQSLSLAFFQRTSSGDLMARTTNDIGSVRMGAGIGLVALVDGVIIGIAAVCCMLAISPLLTVIAIIPAPFIMIFVHKLTIRMEESHAKVQAQFGFLSEHVREFFAGIKVIISHNRNEWAYNSIKDEAQKYMEANISLAKSQSVFIPLMNILTNLGMVIVILIGGRLAILGKITAGDFVAFIAYLAILSWPMMAIGWFTTLFQRAKASIDRINWVFANKSEIVTAPNAINIPVNNGKIKFENVFLKYKDSLHYALEDINLTIPERQMTALVGAVGSGKTSIVRLIPRLMDPVQGRIIIDDVCICNMAISALRKSIAVVPQDVFLFSGSIRYNLTLGKNISDDCLIAALKAAAIDDIISDLPNGLESTIGERGITLSGGQKQRLTIARALLKDPPLLILDDAMSMIDSHTEANIFKSLSEIRKDKTTLVVTHRVSTLCHIESIKVLHKGRLIEEGSHEELLLSGRIYPDLYRQDLLMRSMEKLK